MYGRFQCLLFPRTPTAGFAHIIDISCVMEDLASMVKAQGMSDESGKSTMSMMVPMSMYMVGELGMCMGLLACPGPRYRR